MGKRESSRVLTFGEYVALCGRWDAGALASFSVWLTSAGLWAPMRLQSWELHHWAWAAGDAPGGLAVRWEPSAETAAAVSEALQLSAAALA